MAWPSLLWAHQVVTVPSQDWVFLSQDRVPNCPGHSIGYQKAWALGMAAHVWAATLLYGDMANVSAQIMKNMHVPFKDLARCSNGKRGWELQGTHTLKQMYHPRCQSRL